MIPWLRGDSPFPPIDSALDDPNGLLAAGGDLCAERLRAAYARGIFPWYSAGQPVLWWSPDPRMVLFVDEFRVSRSLRKTLRAERFEVRIDSAFAAVVGECARTLRRGQFGTWITPEVVEAYSDLHALGHAHCVESWRAGELVGGLYGVSLGRMFFGESMFAREPDASKVALAHLVAILRAAQFPLIDCQQHTLHLASLGARQISRAEFAKRLAPLVNCPAPEGIWRPMSMSDVLA